MYSIWGWLRSYIVLSELSLHVLDVVQTQASGEGTCVATMHLLDLCV